MAQRQDRTELTLHRERCFLVGVNVPGRYTESEDPLDELACLVDTAGGDVAGSMIQNLERPHRRTFLGTGKFADMVDAATEAGCDTVVVDDDLSPTQLETIEEACRKKVIDRSEVILDIFASTAGSHQARLQVELAQLQYELPRLARKWTHLERLGGGIGTRGPGESQIETDRRLIRRKIAQLRRELDSIEERKAREVGSRETCFTACLVGYTNAGKSSLLNRLTGSEAFVEDRLFATLDTLTRKLEFPEEGTVALLSDTVGFIRRLPHHLVASFHATLEEAAQADLLLHVVDASDPLAGVQIESVRATLEELGMGQKPRLHILNKSDAVTDMAALDALRRKVDGGLLLSAQTGEGVEDLLEILRQKMRAGRRTVTLRFPAADGKRFALVNEVGSVLETTYDEATAVIRVSLPVIDLERLKHLPGEMTVE